MSTLLTLLTGATLALAGPVTEVRIDPNMGSTEILVTFDGEVEYRDFTMQGPNRIVIDLMGVRDGLPEDHYPVGRGGIVSLTSSRFSDDAVRLVLELESMVEYEVVSGNGLLLVRFPNGAGDFQPWTSRATEPVRRAVTPVVTPAPRAAAPQQQEQLYDWEFSDVPIRDVVFSFSEVSGRSIVAGSGVTGLVNARIEQQPWQDALEVILSTNGLVARELDSGIIRIDNLTELNTREQVEPPFTRPYRINYATATEVATAVQGVLTANGSVTPAAGSNAVIVTDIARVHEDVERLIRDLDVRTPVISISAKLIFVNRTDISDLGVTYDLKDSHGNQINQVAPGAIDLDGDGVIDLPEEQVEVGENIVSLGGNSIAALGNANARVPNPTLTLLSSLLIGRHTLISFIDVLQSRNLSDIQAVPSVTTLDNQVARLQVGERTPLRVLDAGGAGGGGQGAQLPQATVQFQETGVILEATPHVTANDNILLEVMAERSAPQLADSDVGFIFNTQNARSRVLVRDGETVAIAGLTVTEVEEVRSGIPLLMNLPVIGRLFRTTRTQQIQRDLIILVTPTIVRPSGL